MALVDISSLNIGTQISFKTQHPNDNNLYEGTIAGFGNYNVVKNIMDLLPYYQSVKKKIPTLAPMEQLSYFILEYRQDDLARTFVCAFDWVNTSSVKVISLVKYYDFRVYNIEHSEVDTVIKLLQAHGYSCNEITQE